MFFLLGMNLKRREESLGRNGNTQRQGICSSQTLDSKEMDKARKLSESKPGHPIVLDSGTEPCTRQVNTMCF